MVYAGDLKSPGPCGHTGSSPVSGTILLLTVIVKFVIILLEDTYYAGSRC